MRIPILAMRAAGTLTTIGLVAACDDSSTSRNMRDATAIDSGPLPDSTPPQDASEIEDSGRLGDSLPRNGPDMDLRPRTSLTLNDDTFCPQVSLNGEGRMALAWIKRLSRDPTSYKLYSGRSALEDFSLENRTEHRPIDQDAPLICGLTKAIDISEEGAIVLCWQNSNHIYCQGRTEAMEFQAQRTVPNTSSKFAMRLINEESFVLGWTQDNHAYVQIFGISGVPNTEPIDLGIGTLRDITVSSGELLALKGGRLHTLNQHGEILQEHSIFVNNDHDSCLHVDSNRYGLIAVVSAPCSRRYQGVNFGVYNREGQRLRNATLPREDNGSEKLRFDARIAINNNGKIVVLANRGYWVTAYQWLNFWSTDVSERNIRGIAGHQIANVSPFGEGQYNVADNEQSVILTYGAKSADLLYGGYSQVRVLKIADFPERGQPVSDRPRISFPNGRDLNFGSVTVGDSESLDSLIENKGVEELTLTLDHDEGPFTADENLTVPPLSQRNLQVTFNPDAVGDTNGSIRLETNDPDNPEVTMELFGHGEPE